VKARVNLNKIAKGLRGERRGHVKAAAGYFGAMQLVGTLAEQFSVPVGGGRATNATWTERRLLPLAPATLRRLEGLAGRIRESSGLNVAPMQLAALLLEKAAEEVDESEMGKLAERVSVRRTDAERKG
jgi:hypothetical protein